MSAPRPGERGWRQELSGACLLSYVGGARGGAWLGCACLLRGIRHVRLGHTCSLCWESLLVTTEEGAGMWRESLWWHPHPLHATPQWHSLSRHSTFPPGAFLAVELITPFPSVCLHVANSSPLLGSALLTPCFNTQPPPTLADTRLSLGCTRLWYRLSVQVFLCPACHGLATAFSSCSPWSPQWGGFSGYSNISSPSTPPQGCVSHPSSSFIFLSFLSFILPGCAGTFSYPFKCLRSSASVQKVLCVNCYTCRCILDVLVGRSEPQVLFCHLDPFP